MALRLPFVNAGGMNGKRDQKTLRRILFFLGALGFLWGAGYLYSQMQAPGNVQYVTASVSKGPLQESITATGTGKGVVCRPSIA